MNLRKVVINGFKNLKKSIFELNNLTSLISTNNYGKSNVLEAIDFGIYFINASEKTKERMMKWIKGIPLNKVLEDENYRIEFEFDTEIDKVKYIINYGYEFMWAKKDAKGAKIVDEYLKFKKIQDAKFSTYIRRNENEAFYKASDKGRCSTKIKINSNELIINKLKAFDALNYIEIINRLNSLKYYIDRHLDASQSFDADPIVRIDTDELDLENTRNIPRMIYCLKNNYLDKFELLVNSFKSLFPEISKIDIEEMKFNKEEMESKISDDIPFRISNEFYRIMVCDENLNQPINFESMSDGAKRIFLQLATIIIADIQGYSLVAIEEPENSIHPLLLQSYLRIIGEFKGDCKILITSHSPYLLKYLEVNNIYVGVPNNCGMAFFSNIRKNAEKHLEKIASKFDISIGDYIFELLNGNEEEIDELKELLEEVQ